MAMQTSADVLSQEASNFDRISSELKTQIGQVQSVADEVKAVWVGQAGTAFGLAVGRFNEAGNNQVKELADIATNIGGAGITYSSTDQDQSQALNAVDMGI